jgi:multidrug efflux pump subunit AcrA (membrane-fusion protein)
LKLGEFVNPGTLVAHVGGTEVRAPLPGEVLELTRRDGAMAAAGDPLAEVSADKEHAWEALRALWGVGEAEDLEAVQRYARGVPGMPERLQEQAMLTIQAIRARQQAAPAHAIVP